MKNLLTMAVVAIVFLSSCSNRIQGIAGYGNQRNFKKQQTRMMMFSASLTLSVASADSLNKELEKITTNFEGYAVTLGYSQSTIRVPSASLNEAINEISKLGKMSQKSLTGSDVTDEFNDYEVRLDNATKARARYLELLAKAENVEAALGVEKELERLNGEIELLKGKMQRLTHLAAFSTIDIDIRQREKPGVLGYVALGTYKAVKWLFIRG